MVLAVDGVTLGQPDVGAVSIAAGAEVILGETGSSGTTFRAARFAVRAS